MSAIEPPQSDQERRIAELQQVNEELAAELRNLAVERTGSPRRGPLPASREIAKLRGQRDALVAELEELRPKLVELQAHREGLERQNQEMASEIARLSGGLGGVLRRARGRLFNRG